MSVKAKLDTTQNFKCYHPLQSSIFQVEPIATVVIQIYTWIQDRVVFKKKVIYLIKTQHAAAETNFSIGHFIT